MPTKVRKQIYLEPRQNRQLKRLAEARGVSEAAVIRELIDAGAAATAATALPPDRAAWEAIVEFSRQRAQVGLTGEPYKWNRQEIYDERESRYGPVITDLPAGETTPTKSPSPPAEKTKPPSSRRGHSIKKRRDAAGLD